MTSRPQESPTAPVAGYRQPDRGTQPDYLYPPYASTVKRSPTQPLVMLPHVAVGSHRPAVRPRRHQAPTTST